MTTTLKKEQQRVVALVRKLAHDRGVTEKDRIGPEYLLVGIVQHLGDKAKPALVKSGIMEPQRLMAEDADADAIEGKTLPPARPNTYLAHLLGGPLKPFMEGTMSAESALQVLLSETDVRANLPTLEQAIQRHVPIRPVMDVVRALTLNFQKGYRYGKMRYSVDGEGRTSDFADGTQDDGFQRAMAAFYEEKQDSRMLMYSVANGNGRSVFEKNMRAYGPLAADVLAVVAINTITPFTDKENMITVREVGWVLDPGFFHRSLADIMASVKTLSEQSLLRVFPETDHLYLCSSLMPTESLVDEFVGYFSKCPGDDNA